ncbi:hypothetical protein IFM89_031026 [Coptis chinensis]|uniref:Uncharacterized protein n=1 Tax=Coptis chinensis TaxID=261450 RepID=A0A835H9H0_9MAGN|nr:hypothetical protein IFM89_031026 [Coptis chinensis]
MPRLLLSDAAKTLKPKLEFFNSIGLSDPDLAKVISRDPFILMLSLENRIRPSISFLKAILRTDSDVLNVIKRTTRVLNQDPQRRIAPNIALLRTIGVPDDNILKLVRRYAITLLMDRFSEIVEEAKKMKFDPSQYQFIRAIEVLKNWGWSEKETSMAFRIQPAFMSLSEKNIMTTMEFLVNKMGYDLLQISKTPVVLNLSLEKRIIPRISVIKVLVLNGLVNKTHSLHSVLRLSDKVFLEKFVMKFEEKIPELRNVFQGKMNDSVKLVFKSSLDVDTEAAKAEIKRIKEEEELAMHEALGLAPKRSGRPQGNRLNKHEFWELVKRGSTAEDLGAGHAKAAHVQGLGFARAPRSGGMEVSTSLPTSQRDASPERVNAILPKPQVQNTKEESSDDESSWKKRKREERRHEKHVDKRHEKRVERKHKKRDKRHSRDSDDKRRHRKDKEKWRHDSD